MAGEVAEGIFADVSVLVDEQFAFVSLGQGEFGNAFVGQRIVVIGYFDVFRIHSFYIVIKL